MKRARVMKWLTAVLLMLVAIAGTVLILVPNQSWYHYLYERQGMSETTGVSVFEAEFNYDYMVDQVMGHQAVTGMASFASGEHLQKCLSQLAMVYQISEWVCGIGIVLIVGCLILLRNQKWYECFRYGSMVTGISTGLLCLGTVLWRPLRLFVFKNRYGELFGMDPGFTGLLPEKWACYMWLTGVGLLLVMALVFLLIYAGSSRSYRPHRF